MPTNRQWAIACGRYSRNSPLEYVSRKAYLVINEKRALQKLAWCASYLLKPEKWWDCCCSNWCTMIFAVKVRSTKRLREPWRVGHQPLRSVASCVLYRRYKVRSKILISGTLECEIYRKSIETETDRAPQQGIVTYTSTICEQVFMGDLVTALPACIWDIIS